MIVCELYATNRKQLKGNRGRAHSELNVPVRKNPLHCHQLSVATGSLAVIRLLIALLIAHPVLLRFIAVFIEIFNEGIASLRILRIS